MDITKQQWEAFKLTQKLAKKMMYDIFSPEAVRDSGLDKDTYMYIINHKTELHEQYDKGDDDGYADSIELDSETHQANLDRKHGGTDE